MDLAEITAVNRQKVNDFIKINWFSTDMAVRGKLVDMTALDGFVYYEAEEIAGLVTYRIDDAECEIMSLDSVNECLGIGSALVNKVIEKAKQSSCKRVVLITTNDNINAIRFYQKRGFDMVKLYHDSVKASRRLKPSIPQRGEYDIPISHEIEFEYKF